MQKIALVAPARAVSMNIIKNFENYCFENGFIFEKGDFLCLPDGVKGIWSADTKQRAKDFQQFIDRTDITAIFCARGGYGSTHLLPYLDFSPLKTHHTYIVGFSDITILHLALQKQHIKSIHASMPAHWHTQSKESLDSLTNILKQLTPESSPLTLKEGTNSLYNDIITPPLWAGGQWGQLIGGNLTMCVHSLGTPYELDTEGKILVLEEVGEYVYHIDRLLMQLYHAGKFSHLKGLVIGEFSQIKDNEQHFGKSIKDIIGEVTQEFNYPIWFDAPIGHGWQNHAFVLG